MAVTRKIRNLWLDASNWKTAVDRERVLTAPLLVEVLLASYVSNSIKVTPTTAPPRESGRDRAAVRIDEATWQAADRKRQAAGIPSMSVLVDLLVAALVSESVTVTVAAAGTAGEPAAPKAGGPTHAPAHDDDPVPLVETDGPAGAWPGQLAAVLP